ncbi:MAG: hypothetical protein HY791_16845 [Deltaproteobacteria bacterium]|nr:hypothetical protein [Deltaproteobacteria bacterium]
MNRWIVMVMLAFSATAFAEETDTEPDRVVYRKRTDLSFSDVRVVGELVSPGSVYVLTRRRAQFAPRLWLRASFLPELMVSTDTLE